MNQNTEALADLVNQWIDEVGVHDVTGVEGRISNFSEWLAARGVLAVDALTDEQALNVWAVTAYQDLRAALRRCATGEPE
jgi:hypothetical protein